MVKGTDLAKSSENMVQMGNYEQLCSCLTKSLHILDQMMS